MGATYDADVIAWAREQAAMLRAGDFSRLDLAHIADEVEDVGRSEQRDLDSRVAVLLAHLLKWLVQPERRGASWTLTIQEQRRAIERRLAQTPSLRAETADPEWLQDVWSDARSIAAQETGLASFPAVCPWTPEQILDPAFLPEDA